MPNPTQEKDEPGTTKKVIAKKQVSFLIITSKTYWSSLGPTSNYASMEKLGNFMKFQLSMLQTP